MNYLTLKKTKFLKKKNAILLTVLSFCCLLFSPIILAEDSTKKEQAAASSLSEKLIKLNTFQGAFEQIITDEDGDVVEENKGDFLLKRPGFFRWSIKPPFEKLMVSDNQKLWTYDPDLQQATVDPVDERLLQTPMLLLSGDIEQIRSTYVISVSTDENQNVRYKLIPKDDESLFEWMEIIFKGEKVIGMVLFSELGEKQKYTFSNTQQNKKISDSNFTFIVPADVDVIVND